jgi:tripeptidyl-peptidase-1
MKFSRFVLAAGLGLTNAVPDTHVVHERRDFQSSRWVKRDRVAEDVILPVRIGLTQTNLDKAHDYLM